MLDSYLSATFPPFLLNNIHTLGKIKITKKMSEFHSHWRSPSDKLMNWLVRLGASDNSTDNWAENRVDNLADNWWDNWADNKIVKCHVFKRYEWQKVASFKKRGCGILFSLKENSDGRRIMRSPYLMAI